MGLFSKIFSNTRKPEGFWGRMMVNGMNGGSHEVNSHLAAAGFRDITVHRDEARHWLAVTAVK